MDYGVFIIVRYDAFCQGREICANVTFSCSSQVGEDSAVLLRSEIPRYRTSYSTLPHPILILSSSLGPIPLPSPHL